jgi:non-ribosomal peptide synthetase component F
MAALYEAFIQGRQSPLPELHIQYADYARWQRDWLQGEALKSLLAYWRQRLDGAPALLNLPTDHPRPAESSSRGASIDLSLSQDLTASLRQLSHRENGTLFMTLMAALQTLLSRYSRQEDICVGTPIAGRDLVETEGLIGCFINTLVVRSYLPEDLKFRELLQQVRHSVIEAYAHQELPFEKIVDVLGIERQPGYTPLYQVLFNLVKTPINRLPVAGATRLAISPVANDAGTANLDLVFDLREVGGRVMGSVEYRTDLFERETIQRMTSHFEVLLRSIVANPDARLAALEMLTASEKEQQALRKNRRADLNRQRLAAVEPRAVKLD